MSELLPLDDFTVPEEGSTTARRVLSLALRRLPAELLRLPAGLAGRAAPALRALQDVARRLARESPGALFSVLRRPTVGTLLRVLRQRPPDAPELALRLAGNALFELALSGVLPAPVELAELPPRLTSMATRTVARAAPGERGRFERGRVRLGDRVVTAEETGELLPVDRGCVLALVDDNPLAMVELHPDKQGNALDLGGHAAGAWIEALRGAFRPIAEELPTLRDEIDLFVQALVPVGFFPERHLSASYQEAVGVVYLSLHPQPLTLTEALIHEASHNKLNALVELDPLLENAFSPLVTSPVRPDPRPLHGVLLAVHAFLPIARLYERLVARGAAELAPRFERIRQINREGAQVLREHARPTPVGAALLAEIDRWDRHFA